MISVVIPLYNKEKSVVKTLESVFVQSYTNYEVIVVNDGSTDNSLKVIQELVPKLKYGDNRIKILSQKNAGVSAARNRGIREAKGEYIALLDGDDIWDRAYLAEQIHLIQDYPQAVMWGVNTAFLRGNGCYKWEQGLGDGFRGYVENYFGTSHNDLFFSSAVVIRRKVFKEVGYFDERISSSEDLDMWYRIILHYPVAFYDKVLVYYNQNAENRVASDTGKHFPLTRDIKYYFDKHNDKFISNPVFSHYINNYVAANLLKEKYYFGSRQDRIDSDVVVRKLRYEDIHPKYRWIFKTPRWFGWIVYQIVCLKKNLKS